MKKTHSRMVLTLVLLGGVLALGGCSDAKKQLGIQKTAPDEFAVVKRAPLDMPPDYTLRPPRPGANRPQEQMPEEQARKTVFGNKDSQSAKNSDGESVLLQKAGGEATNPEIRTLVDQDATSMDEREQPVAKKLFGLGSGEPEADVVDAQAEAERLKKNREEGKPVTEGKTPSIEE